MIFQGAWPGVIDKEAEVREWFFESLVSLYLSKDVATLAQVVHANGKYYPVEIKSKIIAFTRRRRCGYMSNRDALCCRKRCFSA